jgi:hypothetical protein
LLGAGCATEPVAPVCVAHPSPPSEEVRARLGVITVVGNQPLAPDIAQPLGKGSAAGKGALEGFGIAVAGGAFGGPYGVIFGLFLSPVTATGGAIYGGFAGMNKGEYGEIAAVLQKGVREASVPARLESGCVEALRRLAPQTLLAPTNAPSGTPQTTMRIVPLKFGLDAKDGINPPMTMDCVVEVRLLSGDDGMELFAGQFTYFGGTHTLRQWADDDGAAFRKDVTAACDHLVGQIVERVFLVYPLPNNFLESRTIPWHTKK